MCCGIKKKRRKIKQTCHAVRSFIINIIIIIVVVAFVANAILFFFSMQFPFFKVYVCSHCYRNISSLGGSTPNLEAVQGLSEKHYVDICYGNRCKAFMLNLHTAVLQRKPSSCHQFLAFCNVQLLLRNKFVDCKQSKKLICVLISIKLFIVHTVLCSTVQI